MGSYETGRHQFSQTLCVKPCEGLPRVTPETLKTPFTAEEVKKAVKSLQKITTVHVGIY